MMGIDIALAVVGVGFTAGLVRVAVGPTLADRAVAADVCLFMIVASLALFSLRAGTAAFIDSVLVATALGFVATIALTRLLWRREPEKKEDEE